MQGIINYVYIPEGNKSHAMYWTTEYWIPELVIGALVIVVASRSFPCVGIIDDSFD